MRFYDITVPLSTNTPTYPGDPQIDVQTWSSLDKGDPANVSLLHFGAHSATHVDAPAHFIADAPRADAMPLEVLIGRAQVVWVPPDRASINEAFIADNVPEATERLLFKTRNSQLWTAAGKEFQTDYTYLEPAAARRLVTAGVKLIGIDYLSIEKFQTKDHPTHHVLLGGGVVILEGLNLAEVEPGTYELICLPLKIAAGPGDGAPARAVLRTL